MKRPRGILQKTLLLLILIGLVPMSIMGYWTWTQAESRMTRPVVKYWLVRLARETADALDSEVRTMRSLVQAWASDDGLSSFVHTLPDEGLGREERLELTGILERHQALRSDDLALLLYVRRDGTVLAARTQAGDLAEGFVGRRLGDLPLSEGEQRLWRGTFPQTDAIPSPPTATGPGPVGLDWHQSALVAHARGLPLPQEGVYPEDPSAYAIGFAAPIQPADGEPPTLCLVAIFDWKAIQDPLDRVAKRFRGEDGPLEAVRYDQGYPFLFLSDCTTIIGHERRHLYGLDMAADIGLTGFRDAMLADDYGDYSYEYPENSPKISGFAHCRPPPEGFDWAVGIGLYSDQVYAEVHELRDFWLLASFAVLGLVVVVAALTSARLTRPIRRLSESAVRLGRGEQRERIELSTNDEIQDLAEAFEHMAAELSDKERRLVRAEKEAAWRTMAQQVAHEIKNPLTPILLSAQQIARAHSDGHPRFDDMLEDGTQTIMEQCETLRRIAADFAAFASPRHERKPLDLGELIASVVTNYSRSDDPPIAVEAHLPAGPLPMVHADEEEVRRVLLNLFNNAVEAFGQRGGRIDVSLAPQPTPDGFLVIRIQDDGPGIPPENEPRLFEPAFSTRTGGTGLGLAICRSIMERHDGSIEHVPTRPGEGTIFELRLPGQAPEKGLSGD